MCRQARDEVPPHVADMKLRWEIGLTRPAFQTGACLSEVCSLCNQLLQDSIVVCPLCLITAHAECLRKFIIRTKHLHPEYMRHGGGTRKPLAMFSTVWPRQWYRENLCMLCMIFSGGEEL